MQRAHTPPLFKQWFQWLVPTFVVANVVLFMVINDYPKHSLHPASCFALFLGRFSFQPLKQNPIFGPSSYPSSNQNRKVYISKVYSDVNHIVEMLMKLGALYVENVVHLHGLTSILFYVVAWRGCTFASQHVWSFSVRNST
ncbi:hypothetical protein P8452_32662 [Trifolium repens]|nr:hypothetical protein P8452_32662 [Trifolium repens]